MSDVLAARLVDILRADPLVMDGLERARSLDLPQWRVVSGALYNSVWNHLTGRPSGYGIKDFDVIYHDAADPSYEAEDIQIKRAEAAFSGFAIPVELRNQARTHLWFEARFGAAYAPLPNADASLERYASRVHALAARLEPDGRFDFCAPFGLEDLFDMRIRPNRAFDNRESHAEKAARAQALWPEVSVEPW